MENQALKEIPANWDAGRAEDEDEIDLVELFYVLWGHLWQIIACLLVGAVAMLLGTRFLVTPLYQATSSIYIVSASNNSVVNLTDLQIGSQLTADYQELLLSRPLLEDVIENLDLKDGSGEELMDTDTLRGMVEIGNTSDTRILRITVTSPDPQESADIANELVAQACVYLPQIMETEEPNLVESAIAPTGKSSPSYTKNTLLGGIAGAVLCCAVLVVRYLLDDTFMTPDDVSKVFGVQPLATIPEAASGEYGSDSKRKRSGLLGRLNRLSWNNRKDKK